jgi:hypothetical protein
LAEIPLAGAAPRVPQPVVGVRRTSPLEAFQVGVESRAYLESQGLDLSAEQQTKTKTALEFFAAELGTLSEGD